MKNFNLHIITPVKNSFDTAEKTFRSISNSTVTPQPSYTVYNDFSDTQTALLLDEAAQKYSFNLIDLAQHTSHESPNYFLVLQMAQKRALADNAHLLIVESDVIVADNTLQRLYNLASELKNPGLVAAVTVNEGGSVNFPYLYARGYKKDVVCTKKRLSFCCTLLSNAFLKAFDFAELDITKSWFDVRISQESRKRGFYNYLDTSAPVVHLPHSSRPWKKLKYVNPLLYYWHKFMNGLDKI